jgi:hypothetical protein
MKGKYILIILLILSGCSNYEAGNSYVYKKEEARQETIKHVRELMALQIQSQQETSRVLHRQIDNQRREYARMQATNEYRGNDMGGSFTRSHPTIGEAECRFIGNRLNCDYSSY